MSDRMTQIDADLYDAAQAVGSAQGRTVPEQVGHWMRVGRELEASVGVDHRAVARVLAGQASYDELGVGEQVVVRAAWAGGADSRRGGASSGSVPGPRVGPGERGAR